MNSTKGMSVIRSPVSLSALLRGYSGRHYLDASQETPGQALEEDVTLAEVRAEPEPARRKLGRDKWEFRGDTLERVHNTTRLTLFTPDKVQECPVKDTDFTGKRRTFVQNAGSTKQQKIEDDFRAESKPNRGLLERWTGETQRRCPLRALSSRKEVVKRLPRQDQLCRERVSPPRRWRYLARLTASGPSSSHPTWRRKQ